MPNNEISVIIITRDRADMISACLESIRRCAAAPSDILVGINGPDPASVHVLEDFKGFAQPVLLPGLCRGEARNALISRAKGRWLCFLDDDTVLPEKYFSRLARLIRIHPEAAVFGGGQTLSSTAGEFERAVYALLGSSWGGGPFTERFSPVSGTYPAGPEKFILCNLTLDGWFVAARGLAFEGHLSSAEENLLLNRMAAAGAVMILSGDLNLVHRRRKGLPQFTRQVLSSGRGRAQITVRSTKGFTAFTLLPPGVFLGAVVCGFLNPALLMRLAAVYVAIAAFFANRLEVSPAFKIKVLLLFPVLHITYAAGWFFGLLESLGGRIAGKTRPWRCKCRTGL